MVNQDYSPSETEEDVLDVMRAEWRANPYLIRDQTGHGKGAVNTALTRLTSAGWVRKVTRGLYEFVEDPRDRGEEDHIGDALEGWSHGDGDIGRASDQVARSSLEWLRDVPAGPVQKSDVPIEDFQADDPASRRANTLWNKVIKPSWVHAVEQGYVEKPHARAYHWVGVDE